MEDTFATLAVRDPVATSAAQPRQIAPALLPTSLVGSADAPTRAAPVALRDESETPSRARGETAPPVASQPFFPAPAAVLLPPEPTAAVLPARAEGRDPTQVEHVEHVEIDGEQALVTLPAGTAGELSLYLRVREGTAEVRAEGAAAALLEGRSGELRQALAQEGLALGSFSSGGQRQDSDRPQPTDADPPANAGAPAQTPRSRRGRVHVTA